MRLNRSSTRSGGTAGHARREQRVDLVASGAGQHRLELGAEPGRVLAGELGHDQQARPTAPSARRQLRRRSHDGLDHRADVVVGRLQGLGEQLALPLRQELDVTFEHRAQDRLPRPEVVAQRRPVPLPRAPGDLDQRRVPHAVLGELVGRGIEQSLAGRRRVAVARAEA